MSQKTVLTILAVLAALALIAAGSIVYAYLKPTAEASAPISAVPLTAPTSTPTASAQPTATGPAFTAPTTTSTAAAPAAEPSPTAAQNSTTPSDGQLFEIVPERSEARFIIGEILNGAPKTVVGATNQVSGQIQVDAASPADTRVGVIQVNARTLTTDNEFRNRAIKNRILLTDTYELITFTPTALAGLPANVAVNQPFTFQITGDLTVKGVTRSVTFDAQVTPVSKTEIHGLASAEIAYTDFGIVIPNVPAVTGVDENVKLEIEFVAVQK